jgi:hypothetical protein
VRNVQVEPRAVRDIDEQVAKILRGLANPEPPLDLAHARALLKLDKGYYSTTDDSLLREMFSRLKIAGVQVLRRPTLLADAVRTLSLKALYLPDEKRILLDEDLPRLKHRWNEAHEIGHDIIPWHAGMMIGDTVDTLSPACHQMMEAEANYAAGQLLFLGSRFEDEANSEAPSLKLVKRLSGEFKNTITSTLWRMTEQSHRHLPLVSLVTGHPHPAKRKPDFNPAEPCRYCIQNEAFRMRFAHGEQALFKAVADYCGAQRAGPLGEAEVVLADRNGERHVSLRDLRQHARIPNARGLDARPGLGGCGRVRVARIPAVLNG